MTTKNEKQLENKSFFIEGVTAFPRQIYLYIKNKIEGKHFTLNLFMGLFILGSILFVFALSDSSLEAYIFITLLFASILLLSFMLDKLPAFALFVLKTMQFFITLFGGENKKEFEFEEHINWKDVMIVTLVLVLSLYAILSPIL